jgi:nucleoside-diphosphate-sugar epimerase
MIDGMRSGRYVRIARGQAQKSMVLGADVALLIERWATQSELPSGIYNLTDGYHPTFFELEEALRVQLGKPPLRTIPTWLAKTLGRVGDLLPFFPVNSATIQKITCTFTFSDQKAVAELGWSPRPVLDHLDFITP